MMQYLLKISTSHFTVEALLRKDKAVYISPNIRYHRPILSNNNCILYS
jgi:hypothetical protein